MHWLLPRVLLTLMAGAMGAGLGLALANWTELRSVGMLLGAAIGIGLIVAVDVLRARRLLSWLREARTDRAPHHTGFWGEMGYRVERALQSRDKDLQAARQRIEQFLSAIEASPNGVVMLDAQGQLLWCNSTAADHLGLDPLRDLQQPITNLVRAPEFVAHLHAGTPDEPVQFSIPGRPGTLSVVVRPYGDGQRLLLTQDVTERLRVDGMRRDFVANVSHEIRTPLTVVSGFIETMSQLEPTAAERKRMLELAAEQTRRMRTLVDDLLSLAQLEGSPRPSGDRWVDVHALLQRVLADGQALSAGRHQIEVDEGPGGAIAGNEAELLSAFGNLVSNAVRYTPQGGRIDIVWQLRGNGSGAFEVRDTGPGISADHLPRLGERFYRVDSGRSRASGGTGLGLAIAKHAAMRHGGEMQVESVLGEGSTFRLLLPPARVR
jgi:two-component system phosphate regulon sensor histidine kinase PhoR